MNAWSILSGTLVNATTVTAGSLAGLALGARLPARYQRIVLDCLGLVTVTLGIDAGVLNLRDTVARYGHGIPTYGARLAMVMVGSLILGAVLGTALRIHERIEILGQLIHSRLGKEPRPSDEPRPSRHAVSPSPGPLDSTGPAARFAEGFLAASVLFCVGPLTLLGCLQNGAHGDPSLLYIKSFLDCFASMALAATLGVGVLMSVATVLIFQGGLAVAAHFLAGLLPDLSVQLMGIVGGIVLLATALMLLEIKRIPVANLLPAILLPPLLVWLTERVSPGLLLRAG
jgi:uncharacterized membrane protein YqgA involved in biofilm formation